MQLTGYFYSTGSSARRPATLVLYEDNFTLTLELDERIVGNKAQLKVSDRLGNIERKIFLEQGVFTTIENDDVDLAFTHNAVLTRSIHTLESGLIWVIFALAVTISTGYGFFSYGLPWMSSKVAHMLPHQINEKIARESFTFIDEHILSPSQLNEQRREDLARHFQNNLVRALFLDNVDINFRLHFRRWETEQGQIANALALPSGDIIVTDKFIELTQNQQEIDAVLLHEIGHVVERHSLQMLVQSTLLATVIMMITGETSAIADMGIGLGSLLVSSHYSRSHETEADEFAFETMLRLGMDPAAFSRIMERLDHNHSTNSDHQHNAEDSWTDYLSTHPKTQERIDQADRFSLCYKQGLTSCHPQPE